MGNLGRHQGTLERRCRQWIIGQWGAERMNRKDQEERLEDARDCPGQGWLASGDEIWCTTVGARG